MVAVEVFTVEEATQLKHTTATQGWKSPRLGQLVVRGSKHTKCDFE